MVSKVVRGTVEAGAVECSAGIFHTPAVVGRHDVGVGARSQTKKNRSFRNLKNATKGRFYISRVGLVQVMRANTAGVAGGGMSIGEWLLQSATEFGEPVGIWLQGLRWAAGKAVGPME